MNCFSAYAIALVFFYKSCVTHSHFSSYQLFKAQHHNTKLFLQKLSTSFSSLATPLNCPITCTYSFWHSFKAENISQIQELCHFFIALPTKCHIFISSSSSALPVISKHFLHVKTYCLAKAVLYF